MLYGKSLLTCFFAGTSLRHLVEFSRPTGRKNRPGGLVLTLNLAKRSPEGARFLMTSLQIKSKLILNGEEALTAGVFGVPTIVANGELFWGDDAFEMFLDYCTDPEMMATDAMIEAANLVPSSERKR